MIPEPTRAWIGLGSNLGDRRARLDAALADLDAAPGVQVRDASTYHETSPVGGPSGQGAFLNAAAALDVVLSPHELLRTLQEIETRQGRVRSVRWGERTLDLDLLLHGDALIETPELSVPHPRLAVRRFVLAPLAEIAAATVEPSTGRTIAELLARLDRRPSYGVVLGPGSAAIVPRLASELPADYLIADCSGCGTSTEPVWDAGLEEMTRALNADLWTARLSSERWLVTDFWFDLLDRAARRCVPPPPSWRARFLQARAQVIAPTFVFATSASVFADLKARRAPGRAEVVAGREVPILGPVASELTSETAHERGDRLLADIKSACRATRPD